MSSSRPVSSPARAVVDTVVLRYFLFVGKTDLLLDLLGTPIAVPEVVYSPDEESVVNDHLVSEIERSIRWHRTAAGDRRRPDDKRSQAARLVERLLEVREHVNEGSILVEKLSLSELVLFTRLTSLEHVEEFGIVAPLGAGEAACIAMAKERSMTLVTDDNDALKAFGTIEPGNAYERIRKLLMRAVDEEHVDESEANLIFIEMVVLGFYGDQAPFPDVS